MSDQISDSLEQLVSENTQPLQPPYQPPTLTALGKWSALTLAQSVPIVVGSHYNPFTNTWSK